MRICTCHGSDECVFICCSLATVRVACNLILANDSLIDHKIRTSFSTRLRIDLFTFSTHTFPLGFSKAQLACSSLPLPLSPLSISVPPLSSSASLRCTFYIVSVCPRADFPSPFFNIYYTLGIWVVGGCQTRVPKLTDKR